jgi:hypothetical protein
MQTKNYKSSSITTFLNLRKMFIGTPPLLSLIRQKTFYSFSLSSEGIEWNPIKFVDNIEVLALIEQPMGILDILEEESHFPKANETSLRRKINQSLGKSPHLSFPSRLRTGFVVTHYAGMVAYELSDFLEKNKDSIQETLKTAVAQSASPFVSSLAKFGSESTPEDPSKTPRPFLPHNTTNRSVSPGVTSDRPWTSVFDAQTKSSSFRSQPSFSPSSSSLPLTPSLSAGNKFGTVRGVSAMAIKGDPEAKEIPKLGKSKFGSVRINTQKGISTPRKHSTVSSSFRVQLAGLMDSLDQVGFSPSFPHFSFFFVFFLFMISFHFSYSRQSI